MTDSWWQPVAVRDNQWQPVAISTDQYASVSESAGAAHADANGRIRDVDGDDRGEELGRVTARRQQGGARHVVWDLELCATIGNRNNEQWQVTGSQAVTGNHKQ